MTPTVEPQLMFMSSGFQGADDRRGGGAERRRPFRPSLLRASGPDRVRAERGKPASVLVGHAAAARPRPGGEGSGHPARPDPRRARHAPAREDTDEAGLGAPLAELAERAR